MALVTDGRRSIAQPRPPKARYIEVIEVTFLRGTGVVGDPVRQVIAYYSADGALLAERDDCPECEEPA